MANRSTLPVMALTVLVLSAGGAAGQTAASSGTFTIEVKPTAAEQYAYASRITPSSTEVAERNRTILMAVAALEVIPDRWPHDRSMVISAYREMVSRLNGARLYKNAIDMCDKALAYVGRGYERLPFIAAKGRAFMWLNQSTQARQAFDEAESAKDFEALSDFEKSVILRDAGLFYEKQGDFRVAANHARSRAKFTADDFVRAEALRKAVDLSLKANDLSAARADLSSLSDAALKARLRNLQPPEQDLLRRIDLSIAEYKKKLGG